MAIAKPVAACETVEPISDFWGAELIKYFRTGDTSVFEDHLSPEVSLVCFHKYYTGSDKLAHYGQSDVAKALMALRNHLVEDVSNAPRVFKEGKLSGLLQAGSTNKLSLIFGTAAPQETSCGTTTWPIQVDLLYESHYYADDGLRLPALKALAILPPTTPVAYFPDID